MFDCLSGKGWGIAGMRGGGKNLESGNLESTIWNLGDREEAGERESV